MNVRTYSELIAIPTYKERFEYLKIDGAVGVDTFGYDRYLNQILYHSPEWRSFRDDMNVRDKGRDLAMEGYDIHGSFLLHHLNPITVDDVINRRPNVFDPENVVTTVLKTHNAIHYGDSNLLILEPIVRTKNDTCPWR